MRKLMAVLAAAVAACGSSSSSSTHTITGTIGGTAFTATDVAVLSVAGPANGCNLDVPPINGLPATHLTGLNEAGLVIGISSTVNVCGDLTSGTCIGHANSRGATLFVAKVAFAGGSAALTPKSYAVVSDPSSASGPAGVEVAFGESHALGATCAVTGGGKATSGTIQLTEVSATRVAGHVDVHFQDGGSLQGDFSAAPCSGSSADICTIAQQAVNNLGQPVSICSGNSCQ
jgi:hypothetical protein